VTQASRGLSATAELFVDRTYWYSPYKRRRFENRWDQTFCIL